MNSEKVQVLSLFAHRGRHSDAQFVRGRWASRTCDPAHR